MVVRATEAEIDVVRMNPRDAIGRFEDLLLPALREQEGYDGCYVLLSEEGKVLVLTFWDSEEAARSTQRSGFYQSQIEKISDFVVYRQDPGRDTYDVVVADAPEAAIR